MPDWPIEYWVYCGIAIIMLIGAGIWFFADEQHVELTIDPEEELKATLKRDGIARDPRTGQIHTPLFPKMPQPKGPRNNLLLIKGLGPNIAVLLEAIGVKRYDQIAVWDDEDIVTIDRYLSEYKGRIIQDRWIDQAKLLADGRFDDYEAEFGKIDEKERARNISPG
jgi:predicted flap endonuclease-1-like 5' DNA nuclease